MEAYAELICPIGTDNGETVTANLKRMPHLLVAGGKEGEARRYLYGILLSLIKDNSPEILRLLVTHMPELCADIPHLLADPARDGAGAVNVFGWVTEEVDRRYARLTEAGVRNIDEYNRSSEEKLPYIVCVAGKLEELPSSAKEKAAITAAKARAAGIYLAVASEKADAKTVCGLIKANIPTRIALKTATKTESRVILDAYGAETLEENELIYSPIAAKPSVLKFEPISDEAARKITENAKKLPAPERIIPKGRTDEEKMLYRALELAIETGGVTTALLQRRFGISYAKAARLTEEMEAAGYVGEYEGPKPRAVYITREQLEEIKNSNGN